MSAEVLVLGCSGQLARELERLGAPPGLQLAFAGRERLDLMRRDPGELTRALKPRAVINAAAYTRVDEAERDPAPALRLNRDVPAALARACAEARIPLVHISTDYVFDGEKGEPYVEADPAAPLNVYGRSKAEGEAAVLQAGGPAVVIRTSWLFGAFGANFVKTMLNLARDRDEVAVVADQFGRPTWARDCAAGALRAAQALIEGELSGAELFHLAGEGDAAWADLAEAALEESAARGGPSAQVRRITTAERGAPARRPADSRLDCARIARVLQQPSRPWREGLKASFGELERS